MTDFLLKRFVKDYDKTSDLSVRESYGIFASVVGVICNVLLFAAKFAIGAFSNSVSIIADGFNNLSDAGSSIISFIAVKMANKPADEKHPFGHGRIEYIAALVVSFLILEVGFSFLKDSIGKLSQPQDLKVHTVSIIVLILSIGVKLWLGLFNKKLGKKINSSVMLATATDSIGDVITTSATLVSLLVFMLFDVNIDGIIGIGVSLVVMWAGIGVARDTIQPLLGTAVSKDVYEKIKGFVESYDGILGTHDLVVHNYGPCRSMASVHAEVHNGVDIEVSHEIIDQIEKDIFKQFGIYLVIHMDPIDADNPQRAIINKQIEETVKKIDKLASIHDFRMVSGEKQINLIFDLVVPASYKQDKKDEICKSIREAMSEIDEKYSCVIQVESSFVAE